MSEGGADAGGVPQERVTVDDALLDVVLAELVARGRADRVTVLQSEVRTVVIHPAAGGRVRVEQR